MSPATSTTCAFADPLMVGHAGSDPALPRLVIVGPPGAGKTSVGEDLAVHWSVAFRDTDRDIEQTTGESISDLFVDKGEEYFRTLERKAVTAALTEHRGVLALGGGAVVDPGTRSALATAPVTFLNVGLADAMTRLKMNRSRPLLLGNVRGRWQALLEERRGFYTEVADQVVQTDGRTVSDIVTEIDQFWRARG